MDGAGRGGMTKRGASSLCRLSRNPHTRMYSSARRARTTPAAATRKSLDSIWGRDVVRSGARLIVQAGAG